MDMIRSFIRRLLKRKSYKEQHPLLHPFWERDNCEILLRNCNSEELNMQPGDLFELNYCFDRNVTNEDVVLMLCRIRHVKKITIETLSGSRLTLLNIYYIPVEVFGEHKYL